MDFRLIEVAMVNIRILISLEQYDNAFHSAWRWNSKWK